MATLGTPALMGSPLQRIGIFPVTDATAAETPDLSTWFTVVHNANYTPATGSGTPAVACTVSGTIVTIPAGPLNDAGYIVASGASAQQTP